MYKKTFQARAPSQFVLNTLEVVKKRLKATKMLYVMLLVPVILVACPKYTLSTDAGEISLKQGETTTKTINIGYENYSGPINFTSISGLPTGVTGTVAPASTSGSLMVVTFEAAVDAKVGKSTVIVATDGPRADKPSQSVSISLTVLAKTQPLPASITISPTSKIFEAGSAAVAFTATLQNSSDAITWVLTGPGTLSATTGSSVTYTPPATVTAATAATLAASAGTVTATASITVTPVGGTVTVAKFDEGKFDEAFFGP